MPNYEDLIAEAKREICEITKLQELISILEENFNNPKRVDLLVELFYSRLDCDVNNLAYIAKQLQLMHFEQSVDCCNTTKPNTDYSILYNKD